MYCLGCLSMYEHMNKSKVLKKVEQKKYPAFFFKRLKKSQTNKVNTVGARRAMTKSIASILDLSDYYLFSDVTVARYDLQKKYACTVCLNAFLLLLKLLF